MPQIASICSSRQRPNMYVSLHGDSQHRIESAFSWLTRTSIPSLRNPLMRSTMSLSEIRISSQLSLFYTQKKSAKWTIASWPIKARTAWPSTQNAFFGVFIQRYEHRQKCQPGRRRAITLARRFLGQFRRSCHQSCCCESVSEAASAGSVRCA